MQSSTTDIPTALCLKCGLCCNGVLFKDVELQPGDNPARLRKLGLPVTSPSPRKKAGRTDPCRLTQPCAALGPDRICSVYSDRPTRCAEFECLLFKAVAEDKMQLTAALRIIKTAQTRAARVQSLLQTLGDADTSRPLSLRFQKLSLQMERTPPSDPETLEHYADLTLAVHDLNVLLGGAFHP